MRVLLVNPFYPISETPSPPLGLAYLAGALIREGVEVRILDFVVFPYSRASLEATLASFAPQLIGVTSVTMTFAHAIGIVKDAKQINPELITVMGGPHASFLAGEILSEFADLDVIVRGEGEQTLIDLVNAVGTGRPRENIPGITFRGEENIISTADRTPVRVDSLAPPARHLLPLGRYRALGMPISMTTSRGCPFSCIFCVGRKMAGARVRYRPAGQVVDEMADLSRLGFHQINLADDLFTANPRHCLSVCEEISRRNLTVSWTAFARVDTVTVELLSAMRRAGCHTVSFGVESGNPEMLKRIKKGITLTQVLSAAGMCREAGITAQASFILGLPGETQESLADTLEFGKKLEELGVLYGFHYLAPFPGTDIRENRTGYDLSILSEDWRDYHANRAITESISVRREQLDAIAREWEHELLARLGKIDAERAAGTATPEEARMLTRLEHTVKLHDWMMKGTIEEKGAWPADSNSSDFESVIDELIGRLAGGKGKNREAVEKTLRYAIEGDNLHFHIDKGYIRWAWRFDNPPCRNTPAA